MSEPRSFSFIFVCQAGRLENQALLLAASLRRNLRCDHELIAAVPSPQDTWGALAAETADLLKQLKVRRVSIQNQIDPAYPIGNKVSCLQQSVKTDRLVFVDTDILLLRPLEDSSVFAAPFAAKPADLPNVLHPFQWSRVYRACGTSRPNESVATTLYGQLVLPYFNAGFISVDPSVKMGDAWLECSKRIDRMWRLPLKRPHLDQLALPVAVRKLGLRYTCLPESYNYPVHLKPIDPFAPPTIAHYHDATILRREPGLVALVRELCEEYPALEARLREDPEYAPMLHPRAKSFAMSAAINLAEPPAGSVHVSHAQRLLPELIITGIPRSGTSYLCNLLHRYDNCVVLNEPDPISRPLRKEPIPFSVATHYRDIRRNVLEGKPILNKLRNGKVTDETVGANEQTQYSPSVANGNFVLGMKSPLAFLNRLDALRLAMPYARVVACVRNPYDTIASWKTTFEHLQTADVAHLRHGGLRDKFLTGSRRAALQDVAKQRHPAWRRAAWWRYLAELILEAGPDVMRIAYPELATHPASIVADVLKGYDAGELSEPIRPSTVRAEKRSALDDEDMQAIRALCSDAAAALGVAKDFAAELEAGKLLPTPAAVPVLPTPADISGPLQDIPAPLAAPHASSPA
jgi:hypothetical protein